jgi:hypothetical protein
MSAVEQNPQISQEPQLPPDTSELVAALSNRKRRDMGVVLSEKDTKLLEIRVINDFVDSVNNNKEFRLNHIEFLNNWRATPEAPPEDHPLGDLAANVKTPITTTYIEQWKSRLSKVIMTEGDIAKFYSTIENLEVDLLNRIGKWFNWELRNIVNIEKILADIMHYILVDGFCISAPYYEHQIKRILTCREFELDLERPISAQIEIGINQCFNSLGYTVLSINQTPTTGVYQVDIKDIDTLADVTVVIDKDDLVFELEYDEVVFDGVKIIIPNCEDIIVFNVNEEIEKLPFFGIRSFFSVPELQEMYDQDKLVKSIKQEDIDKIISQADSKTADFIPQDISREQDIIEGADSLGASTSTGAGSDLERRWVEVYRWEGDITYKRQRVPVVAWVAARSQVLIKLQRVSEITKDSTRTCIKHEFITVPGRFYPIGMSELLRHVQVEMDGVHNFRLNSALVATVPFGFYAPAAGAPASIIGLKPGQLYPVKDPNSIVFPKLGWNAVWGFEEEGLIRKYASELAGMGDSGTGTYTSKRTSASEFLGTSQALDIRTEYIARGVLRKIEELFFRIFSLYQQHAKGERAFLIAGLDGKDLLDKLSMDQLQGKLKLQLTGTVRQLSQQLEKETAMQMMSVLMNQFAVQLGIVGPDTIYAAIAKVMEASNYKGVPIHKPQVEPDSPMPQDEIAMMNAGIYPEPHMGEDFQGHLQAHMTLASRPDIENLLNPAALQLLSQHIQQTMQMYQQVMIFRQQQAMQAAQAQQQMATMGVRPGQAGGTDSSGANAGSQQEGVQAPAAPQSPT